MVLHGAANYRSEHHTVPLYQRSEKSRDGSGRSSSQAELPRSQSDASERLDQYSSATPEERLLLAICDQRGHSAGRWGKGLPPGLQRPPQRSLHSDAALQSRVRMTQPAYPCISY